MKRFLIVFSLFLFILAPSSVQASTSFSDLFISVTDMKSALTDGDQAAFQQAHQHFDNALNALPKNKATTLHNEIKTKSQTLNKGSNDKKISTLNDISEQLITYEKKLNPVDKNEKRKALNNALTPLINKIKTQIQNKHYDDALITNRALNSAWTQNEKVVREDDIGRYGQIETHLMMMRIALTKQPVNQSDAIQHIEGLKAEIDDYINGKKAKATVKQDASILSTYLDTAIQQINNNQLDRAKTTLTQFILAWPNVEGDIRNANASLYTEIEQSIPNYAGTLNEKNKTTIKASLEKINLSIQQAIAKDNYNFIDAALILLREGVEALLIIMALVSVTKKAKQKHATKWIIVGGLIGLMLSVCLALSFNLLFKNVGQGRELFEAVVGLASVTLMLIVGMWLHSKSSLKSWQKFINKNITQAISSGSILTFSFVSFLSVFREGAETIIFYAGIAGKISTIQLIIGIGVALLFLIIFALFFDKITQFIPINRLFLFMSILIFVLSFKILGVSIHTLQVLNIVSNTTIQHIPFIQWIGLYPTMETLLPQCVLIVIVIIYLFIHFRKQRTAKI